VTVATPTLLELQSTEWPVGESTLFAESCNVSVSCCTSPTIIVSASGVTLTFRTGTKDTVTLAVPDTLPLVAVIVTVPGSTAMTSPVLPTAATAELLELHATGAPEIVCPPASVTTAMSCCRCVTSSETLDGETITALGGADATVTDTVACAEPLVAVMVAVPGDKPVTNPEEDTEAIEPLSMFQLTGAPAMTAPFASFTVGVSCDVCPTVTDTLGGATEMLAAT